MKLTRRGKDAVRWSMPMDAGGSKLAFVKGAANDRSEPTLTDAAFFSN